MYLVLKNVTTAQNPDTALTSQMSEKSFDLTLSQQFELAKTAQLIENASADQMRDLYIQLLRFHYLRCNASDALMLGKFQDFSQN